MAAKLQPCGHEIQQSAPHRSSSHCKLVVLPHSARPLNSDVIVDQRRLDWAAFFLGKRGAFGATHQEYR
ncbi:MAG TPA: hypothetical protein VF861_07755 [Telluria sp.]